MRWRAIFAVSVVANILLALGWFIAARDSARRDGIASDETGSVAQVKTNVVIRRQYFTWSEVESPDYPAYIANLRKIGCPEQTIRDIIIADVNALYARRRSTEVLSPTAQWWLSEPDSNVVQAAAEKVRALDDERRTLLTSLLGSAWESGDLASLPRPTHSGINLDGPVLGTMPDELKRSVQQIVSDFQTAVAEWRKAQQSGAPQDLTSLARLNQQFRTQLTGVLSPQQLEEFLLRYSITASTLRSELARLKYFDATPDEFRALFRAVDPINLKLQSLLGANDPASVEQRTGLLEQRADAVRRALGTERYAQYQLLREQGYQQAVAAAQEANSPASAPVLFEINEATADELARIRADTNLTDTQRAIEMKRIELEQLQASAAALGQELPPEPPMPEQPPPLPPGAPHLLGPNETIKSISQLYGVPPEVLRAANPGLNMDRLRAGQTVKIPFALPSISPLAPAPSELRPQ